MPEVNIPITKAKGEFVVINTDTIPQEVYAEALALGLKVLANRGTSKITKTTYPKAEELKAAAVAKANEQVELINTGKIKFAGGAKAKKASGAVMTEARRLAKNVVKDELKKANIKISHVEAKEITAAANELLNDAELGPQLIEMAKKNIAEREATPVKIDIKSMVKTSPKLVEKAEARKAKDQLSAKQAGKVKPRAKVAAKAKPAQPNA